MAKTKAELIKEGKELGLNLKSTMSMYELQHRIKDAKDKEKKAPAKAPKSKDKGEY